MERAPVSREWGIKFFNSLPDFEFLWQKVMVSNISSNCLHLFLDEAGDTTFFKRGKIPALGEKGVSSTFAIGTVVFKDSFLTVRKRIQELEQQITSDAYLNTVCSVSKKIRKGGFYFHATDDAPEIRERMFRLIKEIDCEFEIVVAKKIPALFSKKHHNRESEFYADLLSHLIGTKFHLQKKLVLNVSTRGASTKNVNLELAIKKARERHNDEHNVPVVFNVQSPRTEPLLSVADYFCWSIQRIFERGETRHHNFIKDKIVTVTDLYDENEKRVYDYRGGVFLTAKNKSSPQLP